MKVYEENGQLVIDAEGEIINTLHIGVESITVENCHFPNPYQQGIIVEDPGKK